MVRIDCPKRGWPASGMLTWQRDMYSLCRTSSDLSEGIYAAGCFYQPANMLPHGSHVYTEKLSSFTAREEESGLSPSNSMKYPTVYACHHEGLSPLMRHWSREIDLGVQRCLPGLALCAQTFTKARNRESMGQAICRYSSSSLVNYISCEGVRDELPLRRSASLAGKNYRMHSLQQPKTSKQSRGRTCTGCKERPILAVAPAQQAQNKLFSEASRSNARAKKDFVKDHCDGLMPVDPVITSSLTSPFAVKRCAAEDSKSVYFPATNERWAGPAFTNSPPPSALPVPSFTRRQLRASSLEIAEAPDSICEHLSAAKFRGSTSK